MATTIRNLLFFTIIVIAVFCADGYGDYQLVWSDEFDGPNIDTSNWKFEPGGYWHNNEIQYYTDNRPENARVEGGNLIIEAREEVYENRNHTSARMTTQSKRFWTYGVMEARIKLPSTKGVWPAFWMMPNNISSGWPQGGEIDIMEAINVPTWVKSSLHFGSTDPYEHASDGTPLYYLPGGESFADGFHVYSVEWEPLRFKFFVDGVQIGSLENWWSDEGPYPAPFNKDFFFILNVAVGGDWPGDPDASSVFPQQMLVDWVRVYQDTSNIAPTVTVTNPADGTSLPAGDIVIDATASDNDGSVATVEFYEGSNYLGQVTTAPYSFMWSSVSDGCYTITAKAIDDVWGWSTDSIAITVGTGCPQTPYFRSPMAIPGIIEAEHFDTGGEGLAYHDVDPGNNGIQYVNDYRTSEDVDTEVCSDIGGGYNVGWIANNEWLEYTVDVQKAAEYIIDIRVASQSTGGNFHIEFDGVDKTGNIYVPPTDGWQNWTTVSVVATLSAGTQVMRFVNADSSDEYNLNYFDFFSDKVLTVTASVSNERWPCGAIRRIRWETGNPSANVKIVLFRGDSRVRVLAKTENDGIWDWNVPYDIPRGKNYLIRVVCLEDTAVSDFSEQFEIKIPEINVMIPSAGKQWKRGYTYPIRWTGGKPGANVKIRLLKANKGVKTITPSTANDGLFKWKVPSKFPLSDDYSVKVIYLPDTTIRDAGEVFSVINSPIGSWSGKWYDKRKGLSASVEMKVNKNGTLSGSFAQPLDILPAQFPSVLNISGNYTYDPKSGRITFQGEEGVTVQGYSYPFRVIADVEGECVDNVMTGTYTCFYLIYMDGQWWMYDYLETRIKVNR